LEKLHETYKDRAEFFLVYIREAHPTDGWRVPQNDREGIEVKQPKTYKERVEAASDCVKSLKFSFAALVDDMEDTAEKAYAGWPDRLFVVKRDGTIGYAGERGPRGFKVEEVETYLKEMPESEWKEKEDSKQAPRGDGKKR
jgi:hypothetical protein